MKEQPVGSRKLVAHQQNRNDILYTLLTKLTSHIHGPTQPSSYSTCTQQNTVHSVIIL